jgi:hypothetical protein
MGCNQSLCFQSSLTEWVLLELLQVRCELLTNPALLVLISLLQHLASGDLLGARLSFGRLGRNADHIISSDPCGILLDRLLGAEIIAQLMSAMGINQL